MTTDQDTNMPNTELLKKTLAHIEAHSDTWNQHHYAVHNKCGSSYCFAGWAVQLAGGIIDLDEVAVLVASLPSNINTGSYSWEWNDTGYMTIADAAEQLLGIDGRTGGRLFRADNSLDDLRRIVAELCADPEPASAP